MNKKAIWWTVAIIAVIIVVLVVVLGGNKETTNTQDNSQNVEGTTLPSTGDADYNSFENSDDDFSALDESLEQLQ